MQLSSYPILYINNTLFKPATFINWSEAADNTPLIPNPNFTIQQNNQKAGIR